MPNDQLRVFVSSTFRDLQEERSYLVAKVFPEIRKVCRERGVEFTEIDLRWGLTREDSALGRIVRTCFEEIDRCRPYFIGIIGSMYGWVPGHLELQKDPEIAAKYPWVEDTALAGASVLELEMRYGVLEYDGDTSGAMFYIREPRPERDPSTERTRLHELEQAIRASTATVRAFRDPESLGAQVRADLLAIIERDFPIASAPTPLVRERRGHDAFASARRRAYIAHPETINALTELTLFGSSPVLVVAEDGMGKSALLSYWTNVAQKRQPDAAVIAHYVGATSDASEPAALIRRIMGELAERFGIDEPIPDGHDAAVEALPLWFARTAGRKLVLVIDGVDKLAGHGADLRWLPRYLPPSVKLVMSSAPGIAETEARDRGWNVYTLQPLGERERETLLVRYLGEYRKSLSTEQCKRIAADPKCRNPLFLRTLLEELRLAATYEELDGRITRLLASPDLSSLMRIVLERFEEMFGADAVRETLSIIRCAQSGLTEGELADLLPFERARLSQLLIALDTHVAARQGRYQIVNEHMDRAVDAQYLADPATSQGVHARLATYFHDHADPARRLEEEGCQWTLAGDRERAVCTLTDPALLDVMDGEQLYACLRLWRTLREGHDVPAAFARAREEARLEGERARRFDWNAGIVLRELGYFAASRESLERAFDAARAANDAQAQGEIAPDLIAVLYHTNDLARADEIAVAQREALGGRRDDLRYLEATSNLASIRFARGMLDQAATLFRESLAAASERPAFIRQRAHDLNNLAGVLSTKGNSAEALALVREAVETAERSYGADHPETAVFLSNLALFLKQQRRSAEAEPVYLRAIAILEGTYGADHPSTADVRMNFAKFLYEAGRFDEAESHARITLATMLWSNGPESFKTASAHHLLGRILATRGRHADALEHLNAARHSYHCCNAPRETIDQLEETIAVMSSGGKA